jgi:hypothetical protein
MQDELGSMANMSPATLYDHAGVSTEASSSELLERFSGLSNQTPDAFRVRAAIALEALIDEEFRQAYDRHLSISGDWRETNHLPNLPPMPAAAWGSDEMSEWIDQTKAILTPTRREPRPLERLPRQANRLLGINPHMFVWGALGMFLVLAGSSFGNGPLTDLLGVKTLGVPAVAALGAALGSVLGNTFNNSRTWQVRLIIALSTPVVVPLIPVHLGAATLLLVLVVISVSLLARRAKNAEHNWATEPLLPPAPPSPWAPVDGLSATRLGAGTTTPSQAAAVLRAWAIRVGFPVIDASDDDLVSAVVAADAWAFALGADSVAQAASFGPASLGAICAAIARASGHGEPTLALLPGEWASPRRMPGLIQACVDWRSWATLMLGEERGRRAVDVAASDLSWGGGGDDRLARLARFMTSNSY